MNNWRDTFNRMGGHGQRVHGFVRWWSGALASWLPARWRRLLELDGDRLLLSPTVDGLRLQRQAADTIVDIASLPAPLQLAALERSLPASVSRLPRWLMLPNSQVLRCELTLPAGAADHLREVVGFEIDRQTPFSAAQVHYDARPLSQTGAEQLRVELVVVPQAGLSAALLPLGDLATTLQGVDVQDEAGSPLGVNLLPMQARSQRIDPFARRNALFIAATLLALVLVGVQTLHNRRAAADSFAQTVDAQAQRARGVAQQRQQLVDLVEGQTFLDQARAAQPAAVEVINEVSQRLPDDSYLEKLAIEGQQLSLIGLSANASSLVARLEGASIWRKPALTGALQTDSLTRRDRFSLSANLTGTPTPAPSPAKPAHDARLP